MYKKVLLFVGISFFAFFILSVSILKASEIHYAFSQPANFKVEKTGADSLRYDIAFAHAYPGDIAPDSPLWTAKVARDKVWLAVTSDPVKKSELYLLLAEKRLGSASTLFLDNQTTLGISVLSKAEKYLESAYNSEQDAEKMEKDTTTLLFQMSHAAIFHRQIIEDILKIAPEQAKPMIVSSMDYSKRIYNQSATLLVHKGKVPPKNPFE